MAFDRINRGTRRTDYLDDRDLVSGERLKIAGMGSDDVIATSGPDTWIDAGSGNDMIYAYGGTVSGDMLFIKDVTLAQLNVSDFLA